MSFFLGTSPPDSITSLDDFGRRHWTDPSCVPFIPSVSPDEFIEKCSENETLVDGYAPFCKHIFVPNFTGALQTVVPITDEIEPLIRTEYVARQDGELSVLTRYVPAASVSLCPAKYIDVILYSREQIIKELRAMNKDVSSLPDKPWGIISLKLQDVDHELPMAPITMMRNAVGEAEGGSGVPLDRGKYQASVDYWSNHVQVIDK